MEPIAALDDDGRRAPKLGAALIGLVLLVGVGGWLVTMGGYQRRDLVNTPAEATKPAEAAPAAAPEAEATKPEAEPAAGPEAAPEAEPEAEAAALPPEAEHSSDDTAPPPAPRTKKTAPNPRKATPRPQPRPASRPPEPEPAPVITVKPSRPEPEPPPADLPETPGREAVQAALQKVRPRIVECAPGQHGVAEAEITVAGSGEVIHAVIGGYYAAKPEGSCMARALRGARFPRFARPRFTVVYPFRF